MKIAVVGATGILGRQVTARFIERGHHVAALETPAGRRCSIVHERLRTVRGDIWNVGALRDLMNGADVALHLATAIPPAGPNMDWSVNDRIRREGTAVFLHAAEASAVAKSVVQSIAMIAGTVGDEWATERNDVSSPAYQSAVDLERLVSESKLTSTVLRGGLFYGPGTGNSTLWNEQARAGTLQIPEDGSRYISMTHVSDMSRAVVAAAESVSAEPLLNIVDDAPPTWAELFAYIGRGNGMASVPFGAARRFPNFRTSNALAKRTLDWEPVYPSFLSGWHFE